MKPITLKLNQTYTISNFHFGNASDGVKSKSQTLVSITYLPGALSFSFHCHDNPFVNNNFYTQHNSEMWNQEVFEVFITAQSDYPSKYLELEINPNGAVFAGWISNKTGEKPDSCEFLDIEKSGLKYKVSKTENTWEGNLTLPLHLFGEHHNTFKFNMFRIISKILQTDSTWKCDPSNAEFICWQPTLSGDSPRFHRPAVFATLILE